MIPPKQRNNIIEHTIVIHKHAVQITKQIFLICSDKLQFVFIIDNIRLKYVHPTTIRKHISSKFISSTPS